jgi:hypothetical protein
MPRAAGYAAPGCPRSSHHRRVFIYGRRRHAPRSGVRRPLFSAVSHHRRDLYLRATYTSPLVVRECSTRQGRGTPRPYCWGCIDGRRRHATRCGVRRPLFSAVIPPPSRFVSTGDVYVAPGCPRMQHAEQNFPFQRIDSSGAYCNTPRSMTPVELTPQ